RNHSRPEYITAIGRKYHGFSMLPDGAFQLTSELIDEQRLRGWPDNSRSTSVMTDHGSYALSHIRYLEAESIHVLREVAAEFERPVLLYSVGKDSSALLRLAQKAFYPGRLPFPLMHVDTGYKFQEMYAFRDRIVRESGADLIVWRNEPAIAQGAN